MMIKIDFTDEMMERLHYERFNHPHPRVQLKMEAMYLRGRGFSCKDVCAICRISKWTLINYTKDFVGGGVAGLEKFDCRGRDSSLSGHTQTLKEEFGKKPPRSAAEAAERIERITGVKRKLTQVKGFLTKNGFKYRKAGHVPGKGCAEDKQKEQEDFLENELRPRLEEVKKGKRALFFWMPRTSFTERS